MEELDYDLAEVFGIKLDTDRPYDVSLQSFSNKKTGILQNQIYIPTLYPINKSKPSSSLFL